MLHGSQRRIHGARGSGVTGRAVELQMRSVPWSTSGSAVAGRESREQLQVAAVLGCWKGKAAQWYTIVVPPHQPSQQHLPTWSCGSRSQQEARHSNARVPVYLSLVQYRMEVRRPGIPSTLNASLLPVHCLHFESPGV